MSVEAFGTIGGLNTAWPANADLIAEGDDHLRGIKVTLKTVFPAFAAGVVTVTPAEVNYSAGLSGLIQTQLNAKAPTANPTFTGTVAAPILSVSSSATLPAATTVGSVTAAELARLAGVTGPLQTQLDAKAPLASPALTGTPTAPTPLGTDNSTRVATTAFVVGFAFSSTLPGQTGNPRKILRTDGTAANWDYGTPPEVVHAASGVLVAGANNVLQTAGIAMTFPALTVGDEFMVTEASDGSTCTLDFGAAKIRKRTDLPGVMTIIRGQQFSVVWTGATLGFV